MLGYAFMGKAHSNAFRKIAHMTWPPPLRPAARRARRAERGGRGRRRAALRLRALDDRLARHRQRSDHRTVRQRRPELAACGADDRSPPRPASTSSARSRSGRDADESYDDLEARRRHRREAHVRVQLPLRPRGAARARDDRGRRARRDPPLPRPLPPGLGRRPDPRHVAVQSGRGGLRRDSATLRRTSSISRASSSARPPPSPRSCGRSSPDGRWTTRSRRRSSSTTAPSARSSRPGSRSAGATRSSGRSTARSGSLAFDMERMNELQVFRADGDRARGFKTVLVSETDHPFWEHWWPPGHIIGWGDTFVHELAPPAPRDRRRQLRRAVRRHASRTATGRRRSATRSSAPATAARRDTISYRSL